METGERKCSPVGTASERVSRTWSEKTPIALAVILWFLLGLFVAVFDCRGNEQATPNPVPTVTAKPLVKKPVERKTEKVSRSKLRLSSPSKRYAATLISANQMACLLPLWEKESGWSPTSDNPSSSAYGIPQILGLEARTGSDYRKQVVAGLDYISNRYGSPCRAWAFWQQHRWY